MIKLITEKEQTSLFKGLLQDECVQVDTETTGFDPHTKELLSLQLGTSDGTCQYVIDAKEVNISEIPLIKEILETVPSIYHNAKFDLGFLHKHGIYPKEVMDTFLNECIITTGLSQRSLGLDAVAFKYCDAVMTKDIRGNIHREGLTPRVIRYAADDVKFLKAIYDSQMEKVAELGLERTISLESQYVRALAYTEFCGFKLDTEKWLQNDANHQEQEKEAERAVVNWIFDNLPQYREPQLDLFSEDKSVSIKITSTKDMTEVFKGLGVDTTVMFRGKPKDSIESKHLKKFKNEYPLIPIYLKYMEKRKLVTTYGESFLKHVNKGTGRLHSNFWQILNTGRISSSDPNLQNIPSDENIRKCFVADEGNTLVVADYSAQETRVLADMANERNYIEFFKNGDGDSHSMVASRMFSEIEGKPVKVSKTENSDKRQIGKILSFQIAYGASAWSVKDSFGITEKEAQKFIDAYLDSFPDLKKYFEKRKKEVITYGHVTTDEVSKRKIFMDNFDRFSELRDTIKDIYDNGSIPDRGMTREYYTMKGKYERNSLNYPIQSVSASMMKLAGVKVFNHIMQNNLIGKVKIVSFIHDEMCIECPTELASEMANMVQEAMESSARAFCNHVEIPAIPNITQYWEK
tara:strand:- start:8837 stop:10735 length:1899 start_codon:yes stop_codon:yes gene_type:complete